jgi:hypothetical protein
MLMFDPNSMIFAPPTFSITSSWFVTTILAAAVEEAHPRAENIKNQIQVSIIKHIFFFFLTETADGGFLQEILPISETERKRKATKRSTSSSCHDLCVCVRENQNRHFIILVIFHTSEHSRVEH